MARTYRQVTSVQVKALNSLFFLQLFVGIFFLLLGIYGIVPSIQESVFSLWDNNRPLEIGFGIFELCSSLVLLASLIMFTRQRLLYLASIIIFIFWGARIAISKFIIGITLSRGQLYFAGGFYNWFLVLIVELVILMAIYNIAKRYRG